MPHAISYAENGGMTIGYVIYAVLGMFFSTPTPFVALFITLRNAEKITVKEYFRSETVSSMKNRV